MEKKFRNPTLLIGVAMLLLVTGGFLTVLQVGVSSRQGAGIRHGFNFRGGEKKEPSYFDDLERGSDVIKSRTSAFFDDIFGGGSAGAPGQDSYASAAGGGGGYRGYSADEIAGKYAPGDDAFEKYYQDNYGSGSPAYSPSSSYGGGDAGTFYGGGGGGGSSQDIPRGGAASGGKADAAAGEAGESAPEAGSGPAARAGGLAGDSAAPKLHASLPSKGDPASAGAGGAGSGPGGYEGPAFDGGGAGKGAGGKGGGLDAFKGGGAAKGLDGALEGERTGGAGSYGAQMSKSASAVASGGSGGGAGGGAVPAASKAENASSSGGTSSSSSGSSSSSSGPASSSSGSSYSRSSADYGDPVYYGGSGYGGSGAPKAAAADDALLKSVVTERLNGAEEKYVTPEEAQAGVDKALLAAGASPTDTVAKGADEKKPQPDPDSFPALTEARKEELKKEVHVLLRRVETDYGAMKDIQFYSCATYPEICKAHGLTENFLTMTTGNGASITLGVKYVRNRWRTYTLNFKDPSGAQPAPSGKPGAISTGVYGDDGGDEDDEEEE